MLASLAKADSSGQCVNQLLPLASEQSDTIVDSVADDEKEVHEDADSAEGERGERC